MLDSRATTLNAWYCIDMTIALRKVDWWNEQEHSPCTVEREASNVTCYRVQSYAKDVARERKLQDVQFGRKPQKLVVPAHADLANMFDPSTWAMAFPDLFPYGDGVPFLIRQSSIDFLETAQYLLCREELVYTVPGDDTRYVALDRPRWAAHVNRKEFIFVLNELSCFVVGFINDTRMDCL